MRHLFTLIAITLVTVSANTQNTTDEKAIRNVIAGMSEAWTNGDGTSWASYFTEDHDFITWFGLYIPHYTKERNATQHQGLFDSVYKDTKHHSTVEKIRFISKDLVLCHVLAALSTKSEPRPELPSVIYTAILERVHDEWRVVSFHNLDLEVLTEERWRNYVPDGGKEMFSSWFEAN